MASPDRAEARPLDLVRQIVVIATISFMLTASAVGSGLLSGETVDDVQGGALDSDASYLAPAGPAFSIWSVIYAGLIGYAIYQALPRERARPRQRAVGWLVALSAVINGLWLVAAQFWTLPLTVVVIVALLIVLAILFRVTVLTRVPGDGVADALLIDGVTGLHLGWVTLATVANTAALLTEIAPREWADAADALGIAVLAVVAVIGLATAWASGWRVAPGLAIGWGAAWLAVGRLTDDPHSTPIGVTAIVVAVLVALVPLAVAGLRFLRPESD